MPTLGVIPVLIGPLQVLLAILPAILVAVFGTLISLFKPRVMLSVLKLAWRLKIHLAVAALCVAGLVWGARRLWPRPTHTGAGGTAAAGADWPMFRGGPGRAGAVRGADTGDGDPVYGSVRWTWARKKAQFYSSPAVVGNRVYITTVEGIGPLDKNGSGEILCFHAETGALVWSFRPEFKTGAKAYRATFASPVVKGRRLVCGEGLHTTPNCRVVCLDISDEQKIRLLWSVTTDNHVECTPVVADVVLPGDGGTVRTESRVFVGAGDTGGYYCLDLETGAVRWHLDGAKYPDAETALACHSNRVYAGMGNTGKAIAVLDAATGKELGRMPTPYPVFSPPAVADGKLFVGMGNGDFVQSARDLGLKEIGELWCLDLAKMENGGNAAVAPDWKITVEDTVLSAVIADGEDVIFASVNGNVYRVDRRTGAGKAKWEAREPVRASPAATAGHVYVVTASGTLYALERQRLRPVWECRVAGSQDNISSPVIAHGRAYVGTGDSGFVCAGEPAPAGVRVWSGHLAGPGKGGNYFGEPAPRIGQMAWIYPATCDGEPREAFLAAPVAVAGSRVLVPWAEKPKGGPEPGLTCLASAAGREAPAKPEWHHPVPAGVFRSPAVVGDTVLLTTGKEGGEGRELQGVALDTGKLLWRRPLEGDVGGAFVADASAVYLQDRADNFSAYVCASGKWRWSARVGGRVATAAAVTPSLVALAVAEPAALVVLDRLRGVELLRAALPSPAVTPLYAERGTVWYGTRDGVEARRLTDGQRVEGWRMSGEGVSGDFALDDARIAYVGRNGKLMILNRKDGAPLAASPAASAGTAPMLCRERVLYFDKENQIQSLDLEKAAGGTASPECWLSDTSALGGAPSTPMVLAGPSVYVGWPGWGLLRLGEGR